MVLPETDEQGALLACERIRAAVESLEVVQNGQILKVSITLGAALYDRRLGAARSLALADKALYRGKQTGRNRVVLWNPADTPAPDYEAAEKERQLLGDEVDLLTTGRWQAVSDEKPE